MMRARLQGMSLMAVAVLFLSGVVGIASASDGPENQWGPFEGQVLDANTGQAIPGAMFFAVWLRTIPAPIHSGETFNDARYAVAGKDGRFKIPRRKQPIFSSTIETVFLACVAPGYQPKQGTGVVPLPAEIRLTPFPTANDARRSGNGNAAYVGSIPYDKLLKYQGEINVKRKDLGLPPVDLTGAL